MKKKYLIILLTMCTTFVIAEDDDDINLNDVVSYYGDMAAEVLVNPRSSAVGGADLATNLFAGLSSNPALAARVRSPELHLSYSSYYSNVFSASRADFAMPVPAARGGVSATFAFLHIPGIEDTRAINPEDGVFDVNDIKTFSAWDIWTRLGYGHTFDTPKISYHIGGAVTARLRDLGDESAYGIGADIGAVARFKQPNVYAALLWENVRYSHVRWHTSDYSEEVPQHLRLSLAYEREDPYIYGRISFFYTSPDLLSNEGINYYGTSHNIQEENRVPEIRKVSENLGMLFSAARFGVEYTIMKTLSLRAGYVDDNYTLGAGVELFDGRAGVDLSYLGHSELSGTVKVGVYYRWR